MIGTVATTACQNKVTWALQTGNMYTLTSNTAPSPYVASALTTITGGQAYNAFDATNTAGVARSYQDGGLGVQLLFGQVIRISKLSVRGTRSGQATWNCVVYGIKEDNTDVQIYNGNPNTATDTTINSTDTNTPFKGIKVYLVNTRSDLICSIDNCKITEWYTKV